MNALFHPFKALKRYVPRSLLGRFLLLIIMPVVLVELISGFIFFDRHWDEMTRGFASTIAGDVGFVVDLVKENPPSQFPNIQKLAQEKLGLSLTLTPSSKGSASLHSQKGFLENFLKEALRAKLSDPFQFQIEEPVIKVDVMLPQQKILSLEMHRKRLFSRVIYIFLWWTVGASIVFLMIFSIFLKNQIRPLKRLAVFADHLGKGQEVSPTFRGQGALEIRKVGSAFFLMSNRLKRFVEERTRMLAGVSHDLRTPLTRMRLQLALMKNQKGVEDLKKDVEEMEKMVESYLTFSRGEAPESPISTSLEKLVQEALGSLPLVDKKVAIRIPSDVWMPLSPVAMKRCFRNLFENALKFATATIEVSCKLRGGAIEIIIDDDGPGIADIHHHEVFQPFYRLEESRNTATGGIGLGLSIVKDIIRSHGGAINLARSPLGGLRVRIRLPYPFIPSSRAFPKGRRGDP